MLRVSGHTVELVPMLVENAHLALGRSAILAQEQVVSGPKEADAL